MINNYYQAEISLLPRSKIYFSSYKKTLCNCPPLCLRGMISKRKEKKTQVVRMACRTVLPATRIRSQTYRTTFGFRGRYHLFLRIKNGIGSGLQGAFGLRRSSGKEITGKRKAYSLRNSNIRELYAYA